MISECRILLTFKTKRSDPLMVSSTPAKAEPQSTRRYHRTDQKQLTAHTKDPAQSCLSQIEMQITSNQLFLRNNEGNTELFEVSEEIEEVREVWGVFGVVIFNEREYLIIIEDARVAATLPWGNWRVYEATRVRAMGLRLQEGTTRRASADDGAHAVVSAIFALPGLYFSAYPLDYSVSKLPAQIELLSFDSPFLFNSLALQRYTREHTHFGLRCIQGFVGVAGALALLSRRAPARAGVRFFSRGADVHGNCSNTVETEQVMATPERLLSYVQLRGSLPFCWRHYLSWRYAPQLILGSVQDACHTFVHVHQRIVQHYGSVIYLNLIRQCGYEQPLGEQFNQIINGYSKCADEMAVADSLEASKHSESSQKQARLTPMCVHYDFHNSTQQLPLTFVNSQDFTVKPVHSLMWGARSGCSSTPSPVQAQQTVIRTNCIDCLDRTNAVQFFIAREMLKAQVQCLSAKEVCAGEGREGGADSITVDEYLPLLIALFKANGDALSLQYAGTPALSSNHITGRSSTLGRVADGIYSLHRYFINRALHKELQLSYEIATGQRTACRISQPLSYTFSAILLYLLIFSLLWLPNPVAVAVLLAVSTTWLYFSGRNWLCIFYPGIDTETIFYPL